MKRCISVGNVSDTNTDTIPHVLSVVKISTLTVTLKVAVGPKVYVAIFLTDSKTFGKYETFRNQHM